MTSSALTKGSSLRHRRRASAARGPAAPEGSTSRGIPREVDQGRRQGTSPARAVAAFSSSARVSPPGFVRASPTRSTPRPRQRQIARSATSRRRRQAEGEAEPRASSSSRGDLEKGARRYALHPRRQPPIYDAPADVKLAEKHRAGRHEHVHLASHLNETVRRLLVVRAARRTRSRPGAISARVDGTVRDPAAIIAPLHGGRSDLEILAAKFAGENAEGPTTLVQQTVKGSLSRPAAFARARGTRASRSGVLGTASAIAPRAEARQADITAALAAVEGARRPSVRTTSRSRSLPLLRSCSTAATRTTRSSSSCRIPSPR